ncbi:MAG: hypothetical protein Q9182_002295 [Xanthomendoza sp. 2 TL-2023]
MLPLLLLLSATATHAVSITISQNIQIGALENTVTCPHIAPGTCCRAPTQWARGNGIVTFRDLQVGDIGAIFRKRYGVRDPTPDREQGTRYSIGACSGSVMASRSGPGDWVWSEADVPIKLNRHRPQGASFISLPKTLPPVEGMSGWMMAEGLLGMSWGGGEWFASEKARRSFGRGNPRSRKRDIRSKEKGEVWVRSPVRECFPSELLVNGTRYLGGVDGDLMYRSTEGRELNATTWFV